MPGFNRCYRKSVMPIAVSVAVMVAGRWEWQVVGVVKAEDKKEGKTDMDLETRFPQWLPQRKL